MFRHTKYKAERLNVKTPRELEVMWVRLTPPCHPRHTASIICGLVYHPTRAPTHALLVDHIIDTCDTLQARYQSSKMVICGDFNQLDPKEIEDQLSITQIVHFPTHKQNTLDLIITDLSDQYLPPQPLPPVGRSNHLSMFWTPATTTSHDQDDHTTKICRPTPDSAIRQIGQWLIQYPWTEVLTVSDVDRKWENYQTTITQAYYHFFPTKEVRNHPADLPWITPRIKRLMEQRNKTFYNDRRRYNTRSTTRSSQKLKLPKNCTTQQKFTTLNKPTSISGTTN
ncbi:hypothetical protein Pcinc_002854 [Petrolisthes cinctipes]|uniref:Endonuclease/exonuclease/phosphatase domain-containing protein n=1 Tax=Petrolisthes cinctipes TaxID=88211 RepID=A0AAE1GPJ0_PETCI|nr:hypothetical protein Pcinc_002854 [Petrolisthes cinctipes]